MERNQLRQLDIPNARIRTRQGEVAWSLIRDSNGASITSSPRIRRGQASPTITFSQSTGPTTDTFAMMNVIPFPRRRPIVSDDVMNIADLIRETDRNEFQAILSGRAGLESILTNAVAFLQAKPYMGAIRVETDSVYGGPPIIIRAATSLRFEEAMAAIDEFWTVFNHSRVPETVLLDLQ